MAFGRHVRILRHHVARVLRAHARLAAVASCALPLAAPAQGVELPVPCAAGSCGINSPAGWVSAGGATLVAAGNQMTVTQATDQATLNWRSFNVSADGRVTFVQPSQTSIAVNRIFETANPAVILGRLDANGRVFLLNRNGIVFGEGSQVNVGGLLASTLDFSPAALERGIAEAISAGQPAFQPYAAVHGVPQSSGAVEVRRGAVLQADGGQVLLFAPTVTNEGTIRTPDGQTILAAGDRIFLLSSPSGNLRGLLIEVGDGGTVTNGVAGAGGTVGEILADRGNATLAGLAVNQWGRVSATTSVRANGSVRLQARDTTETTQNVGLVRANRNGALRVGPDSRTTVTLDAGDDDRAVDVTPQPESTVGLWGRSIAIGARAQIVATSGSIEIEALGSPAVSIAHVREPDDARVLIAAGATLDVSGAVTAQPMERNSLRVELRGTQLADSPVQRDGPLRTDEDGPPAVYVDVRDYGVRDDGTSWVGTPLADLSGDVSNIQRSVAERNLDGGQIAIASSGAVFTAAGSALDAAGGRIEWQDGYVRTSRVLGADGTIYELSQAEHEREYLGVIDDVTARDLRWGTTSRFTGAGRDPRGRFEQGYVEGRNAGSIAIVAPAVVLDGGIDGSVAQGPLQRIPGSSRHDGVPEGARLTIGNPGALINPAQSLVARAIDFGPSFVLDDPRLVFDPLGTQLPPDLGTIRLRPEIFGPGGVQHLVAVATGRISLRESVALDLGAGGSLALTGGQVAVLGDVTARGGRIALDARPTPRFGSTLGARPTLVVGEGSVLDVRGRWINEDPRFPRQTAPLFVDGGGISVSVTDGDLQLASGSVLEVSAGARRRASGRIDAGRGGSVEIDAERLLAAAGRDQIVELGAELRGYALSEGGTVSVAVPGVCVGSTPCTGGSAAVPIGIDRLLDRGFGSITVGGTAFGLTVQPRTEIALTQRNWVLRPGAAGAAATGAEFGNLVDVATLPEAIRRPANLTLASFGYLGTQGPSLADLRIGEGARIAADPGGAVALRTDSRIFLEGSVVAQGGSFSATITDRLADALIADQGIWLGSRALVDVSGTTRRTPNELGRITGTVLSGGTVTLRAQRGYLVAQPGSRVVASGAVDVLDVATNAGGQTVFERRRVGSVGGSIDLFAIEGMLLGGELIAARGTDGLAGGRLSIGIDASGPREPAQWPQGSRVVRVTGSVPPPVVGLGLPVPPQFNGIAFAPAETVDRGGFDFVELNARNLLGERQAQIVLAAIGRIELDRGVVLSPAGRLVLDAPVIAGRGGGEVVLRSEYVALGPTDPRTQATVAAPESGGTRLSVEAALVDLVGTFAFTGTESVVLASRGDVRLRGTLVEPTGTDYIASVRAPGELEIRAGQIYPTTLTDATLAVTGPGSRLTIRPVSRATPSDVYSAGGRLTLRADSIVSSGTVRAPLGTVVLEADTIRLLAGSETSTSARGLEIPFGTTQGGLDWAYELRRGLTRVFGVGDAPLPSQQIRFTSETLELAVGAVVDVSGGGDLLAYEFLPGVGGTRDVLLPSVRPDEFAILPGSALPFAPFDPAESRGSVLQPGANVYLAGIDGLPAGTYTLLPARYALLPGAFLVRAVDGYQDLAPGERRALLGGATVTAGFRSVAGAGALDSRFGGFALRPANLMRREAQYTVTSADDFFLAQAAAAGAAATRVPRDAGTVAFDAARALDLSGSVASAAATGGRGAAVDITGARLSIVGDLASAPATGVAVSAAQLSALRAESIAIGGSRRAAPAGTVLTVAAGTVTVTGDAEVEARELLIVARDLIDVEAGAELRGAGAAITGGGDVLVPSGTALLRASTARDSAVVRTAGTGSGSITVAEGARLAAEGTLALDAAGRLQFDGALDVATGATVRFGAGRIAIGDPGAAFAGFALRQPLADSLAGERLQLVSPGAIELYGATSLAVAALELEAPGVSARTVPSGVPAALRVEADTVFWRGTAGATTAGSGRGTVAIRAGRLETRGGRFTVDGTDSVAIDVAGATLAAESGSLLVAGDLSLTSGLIETAPGVDYGFESSGRLQVTAAAAVAPSGGAGLAGALAFVGRTIALDAPVRLPGGRLELRAVDDVFIGPAARLDLAGGSVSFDGVRVAYDGGTVLADSVGGSVRVDAAAVVDVSPGPGGGRGGAVQAVAGGSVALGGALRASSPTGSAGGTLRIDAARLDFDAVLGTVDSAGFTRSVDVRLRGPGDLVLGSGRTLRAEEVRLVADRGAIRIDGAIDARAAPGGRVDLHAATALAVNGRVDTRAATAVERGGQVAFGSGGSLSIGPGAVVQVGGPAAGAATGSVHLRLPAERALSELNGTGRQLAIDGAILGAQFITLEGYRVFQGGPGADVRITSSMVAADAARSPYYAAAQSFSAQAAGLLSSLGLAGDARFEVLPGIEIGSSRDIWIDSAWDLSSWRFLGNPGVLTLRAARDLRIDRSISDGFAGTDAFVGQLLPLAPSRSWSYRLVAGADLGGTDPLAIQRSAAAGDLRVSAGRTPVPGAAALNFVRTGTGFIELAAARDVVLAAQSAVVYTAGTAGPGVRLEGDVLTGELGGRAYPIGGGDLRVRAGRDVVGAFSDQLFSDWLWRAGMVEWNIPTAWTIDYGSFQQGFGALGGGHLRIEAARDLVNVNANVPTIGAPTQVVVDGRPLVDERNRGRLDVSAGRDVRGGKFLSMAGSARIVAGGGFRDAAARAALAMAPTIGQGSGDVELVARQELTVEGVVHPTLVIPSLLQQTWIPANFATYSEATRFSAVSIGSDLVLRNASAGGDPLVTTAVNLLLTQIDFRNTLALRTYAPSTRAASLGGSVRVQGNMNLWPAAAGTLELFGAQDVSIRTLSGRGQIVITMSDIDPVRTAPTVARPSTDLSSNLIPYFERLIPNADPRFREFNARTPVHAGGFAGAGPDVLPSRIVALAGDVELLPGTVANFSGLFVPEQLRVIAAGDIVDLGVRIQHFAPGNVSLIRAGGAIRYSSSRDSAGRLEENLREIAIAGPGRLLIQAGGSLDLQTSRGITSEGNLLNTFLPDGGADLAIRAGVVEVPGFQAFVQRYLATGSEYLDEIAAYMRKWTGDRTLAGESARAAFLALPVLQQDALVEQVLFAELRAGGRAAQVPGDGFNDYRRAFDALETLFPGSNPDPDGENRPPYAGDVALFFSRVYTLDGGDISFVIPGGGANVGLAAAPVAFGIFKSPAQLGIVAQRFGSVSVLAFDDLAVNESRMFAADGGDILIWSTQGDIDAGRGAKTAISAPPPIIVIDSSGQPIVTFPAALTGSGIQTLATSPGTEPGDVDLYAPRGVVNAGDAGIVAGNLTIGATAVLGAGNITVRGTAVGIPVDTGGLGAALAGVSGTAGSAAAAAQAAVEAGQAEDAAATPLAEAALKWLDVFVIGLGEEGCRPDDLECLRRQALRDRGGA